MLTISLRSLSQMKSPVFTEKPRWKAHKYQFFDKLNNRFRFWNIHRRLSSLLLNFLSGRLLSCFSNNFHDLRDVSDWKIEPSLLGGRGATISSFNDASPLLKNDSVKIRWRSDNFCASHRQPQKIMGPKHTNVSLESGFLDVMIGLLPQTRFFGQLTQ